MANLTQSLSSSLNFFGIQPPTRYGSPATWGTDLWGLGGNTHFNMPTASTTPHTDTETLSDSASVTPTIFAVGSISFTSTPGSEELTDYSGKYNYLFRADVINDENAYVPTYSVGLTSSTTWVQQTSSTVSWVNA